MKRLRTTATGALLALFVATGCGGDGASSSNTAVDPIATTQPAESSPTTSSAAPADTTTSTTTPAAPTMWFWYDEFTGSVSLFDPESGTASSQAIDLRDHKYGFADGWSNRAVQYTADGSVAFVRAADFDNPDTPNHPTATQLLRIEDGESVQLLELLAPLVLMDWTITTDGSRLYYLVYNPGSQVPVGLYLPKEYDFHVVDTVSGVDNILKSSTDGDGLGGWRMQALDDGVRYYVNDPFKLFEEGSNGDDYIAREVMDLPCGPANHTSITDPLSPDGKMVVFRCEDGGGTRLVIADVTTGATREVARETDRAIRTTYWSADGTKLVYDVAYTLPYRYDERVTEKQQAGFVNALVLVDVTTGATTTLVTDESPGPDSPDYGLHLINALSFSPDGRYVAYANSGTVHLYELATGESVDTGIAVNYQIADYASHGWFIAD